MRIRHVDGRTRMLRRRFGCRARRVQGMGVYPFPTDESGTGDADFPNVEGGCPTRTLPLHSAFPLIFLILAMPSFNLTNSHVFTDRY